MSAKTTKTTKTTKIETAKKEKVVKPAVNWETLKNVAQDLSACAAALKDANAPNLLSRVTKMHESIAKRVKAHYEIAEKRAAKKAEYAGKANERKAERIKKLQAEMAKLQAELNGTPVAG
jgi:hypothetical protein